MKLKRNDVGDLEIGSWVAKQFTGNHYTTRARRLAADFAFDTLHAPKIVSRTHIGNIASRKSVEQNGYQLVDETDDEWVMVLERNNGN